MEIKNSQPPNIDQIRQYLTPPEHAVFCYGDTIYNPSGQEIEPDLIYHESIHSKQQEEYSSPDVWYAKYLVDKQFRLNQELEAYGEQYKWIKKHGIPEKYSKMILEEMAEALSLWYNLGIDKYQAETLIRNYGGN